jgi:hypothetical protein
MQLSSVDVTPGNTRDVTASVFNPLDENPKTTEKANKNDNRHGNHDTPPLHFYFPVKHYLSPPKNKRATNALIG